MFRKVIGQKSAEADADARPATASEAIPPPQSAPAAARPESSAPSAPAQPSAQAAATPAASRNVLSSDVEIKGSVKFTNDLVVDGKIEGEIASEGNLTVGENARLKAEIKTATVVVYGKVHGNIIASERVDLKASAEVVGDIQATTLSIESGAIFVGKSIVGTPSTPTAGAGQDAKGPSKDASSSGGGAKGSSQSGGGSSSSAAKGGQAQGRSGESGGKPQQGNLSGIKG